MNPNCPKCDSTDTWWESMHDCRPDTPAPRVLRCRCGLYRVLTAEQAQVLVGEVTQREAAARQAAQERLEAEARARAARAVEDARRILLEAYGPCAWPGCGWPARPRSKYCSTKCKNNYAHAREREREKEKAEMKESHGPRDLD